MADVALVTSQGLDLMLAGRWDFFDEENFQGAKIDELGPGVYLRVQDHGLTDNSISSIRLVSPSGREGATRMPWPTGTASAACGVDCGTRHM